MQLSPTTTKSDTYTVTLVIPKSQVSMLDQKGATLVDQGGNSYFMIALMISDCKSLNHGISKPTSNGETNSPYLLQPSLSPSYSNKEIPSSKIPASLMSSGERKKGDNSDDPSNCNENSDMGGRSKWKMVLQVIISAVASKTQDVNLTDSGTNLSDSGPRV